MGREGSDDIAAIFKLNGVVSMATNFSHLLSKPIDSVKRPPLKPAGTYYANVMGYKFEESKQKKTPYVRFQFNNVQPGPDIQSDQLVDQDGGEIDLAKWQPHFDFYLTDASLFRLKEFIESCQVPTAGRAFDETIPELKGLPVLLTVIQKPSDAPGDDTIYNNISAVVGQK